jgi:hypothetical protein
MNGIHPGDDGQDCELPHLRIQTNDDPLEEVREGAGKVGLSMQSRLDVVVEVARKYRRAGKREKGEILDSLVNLTG